MVSSLLNLIWLILSHVFEFKLNAAPCLVSYCFSIGDWASLLQRRHGNGAYAPPKRLLATSSNQFPAHAYQYSVLC